MFIHVHIHLIIYIHMTYVLSFFLPSKWSFHGLNPSVHPPPWSFMTEVMTSSGFFDVWPRIWLRRSSRSFSIRNVLFWQSYVKFLKSQVPAAVNRDESGWTAMAMFFVWTRSVPWIFRWTFADESTGRMYSSTYINLLMFRCCISVT